MRTRRGSSLSLVCLLVAAAATACVRPIPASPESSGRAFIQEPEDLRQWNWDDTVLDKLAVAKSDAVVVSGATRSQSLNDCKWDYRIEVELREAREAFQYQPTHVSAWIRRGPTEQKLFYPVAKLEDLKPEAAYKWIARERVRAYFATYEQGQLVRCDVWRERVSETWAFHHLPLQFSFRTPPAPTLAFPAQVQIEQGQHRSGTLEDLKSDDDKRYLVDSAYTGAVGRTVWVARFAGLPKNLYNLTFRYQGMSLRTMFQRIEVYHPTLNRWLDIDYRALESYVDHDIEYGNFGAAEEFVDAQGNLKVRVICEYAGEPFFTGADLVSVTYNTAAIAR